MSLWFMVPMTNYSIHEVNLPSGNATSLLKMGIDNEFSHISDGDETPVM